MIDRSLNYRRTRIKHFIHQSKKLDCVVDLGAGNGADLMTVKSINPNADLNGLEFDESNIQQLIDKGTKVFQLDIEKDPLPFSNESVDLIILNQFLEHTKEVFWILHEITRVLKVGGRVIIGVPNLASFHNRLLLALGRQPSPIKTNSAHVRGFTKGDVLEFLTSCFPSGYELIDFKGSNFYPFPPLIAKPLSTVFPTMAWGIFFLLEKKPHTKTPFFNFQLSSGLKQTFGSG